MDGTVKKSYMQLVAQDLNAAPQLEAPAWIDTTKTDNPKTESTPEANAGPSEYDLFSQLKAPRTRRVRQVWAIGGGKGGVGKSLIASSLAISVARTGAKTVAVDLDLGGANLHTTLGMDLPKYTLSDFFSSRVGSLESCQVSGGVPHLEIISGAQDAVGVANIAGAQRVRLLQGLLELDADYLILDLGAGTTYNTIDFFLFSDIGLITVLPEPTSIENAYRFIKASYYRHLRHCHDLKSVHPLIEMAMDMKNPLGMKTPSDLFREINKVSPEAGLHLKRQIERFRPKLIVNQVRSQTDIDIGYSVRAVCKKYFGIDVDYIGYLDYDAAVWQSIRRKRPLFLEFPNTRLVSSLERVSQQLLKHYGHDRNPLLLHHR